MQRFDVKPLLRSCYRELIFGGHLQCLGASAIPYVAAVLLQIEVRFDCLFAVYLIFYPLYLFNRYKELDVDETTNPQRTKHIRKYQRRMPALLVFVIIVGLTLIAFRSNVFTVIASAMLLIFGLLYTVFFKWMTRYLTIFKNLYVAAFFAVLVVYPVLFYGYALNTNLVRKIAVLFFFVYLNAVIMQIILDIKDLESDREEGLNTLPVLWGKAKTIAFVRILSMLTAIGFPLIFSGIFNTLTDVFWALSLIFPFHLLILDLIEKDNRTGYHLAGAQFLAWVPLLWLGEILFL